MRHERPDVPPKLDGLRAARRLFESCVAEADQSRECMWVAYVDAEGALLELAAHPGEETGVDFPIRQIVASIDRLGASGIILAHNHPSGDPRPSDPDHRGTRRIAVIAEALDCVLLDHLILADGTCTSFRTLGLL